MRRTVRNQTYILIYQLSNNALVYYIDCKYSPDVYFLNTTIVFFVRGIVWTLGMTYYVAATEGVVTADQYCGTESGGFGGKLFSNLLEGVRLLSGHVKVTSIGDSPFGVHRCRPLLLLQRRQQQPLLARWQQG